MLFGALKAAAPYQLAVVVDDAEQAINVIARGATYSIRRRDRSCCSVCSGSLDQAAHLSLVLGTDRCKLRKHEAAPRVDVRDPLSALNAALTFLGQPVVFARDPAALLAQAMQYFDARAIPRIGDQHQSIAAVRKATFQR